MADDPTIHGILLINSDNTIEINKLRLGLDGSTVTTASVAVTLYNNETDTEISGETWPLAMSHVGDGLYQAGLSDSLSLSTCLICRAHITADNGAGLHREWIRYYKVARGAAPADIYLDDTDHVLELNGLQNSRTGAYINGATVQVTLYDLSDTTIAGETWPLTLSYVASSNGIYRATIRDTLDLDAGDVAKALLTADNGAGYHRNWYFIITAQTGV